MKPIAAIIALCIATQTLAAEPSAEATAPAPVSHRYLIERTFPAGALKGLDAATKRKVNANNGRGKFVPRAPFPAEARALAKYKELTTPKGVAR